MKAPSKHADLAPPAAPARKVTSASVLKALKGSHHYHWCLTRDCTRVYGCACKTPDRNGQCQICRHVRRPVWDSARDPQKCCVENCVQVIRPDELQRYRLAGPGPWFQCKTCARCHGRPVFGRRSNAK